mmetsp:Transcript_22332/g.62279  ORF Transcript_22332/g.62279 Transcript_22332/m.62279 type:complete len:202 (+) Transcript_22332:2247-2852(+)
MVPTYPKSASAISPGPFTMHPITATVTPGRCPVAAWMSAVVSWRSNRVRPHDGHETNSVLVLLMRDPCRVENDVDRRKFTENLVPPVSSIMTPSPFPSVRREPTLVPSCKASSLESSVSVVKWWITAVWMSLALKISNTRRDACRAERPSFGFRKHMAGLRSFTFMMVSSSSSPLISTAKRMAPSGSCSFVNVLLSLMLLS